MFSYISISSLCLWLKSAAEHANSGISLNKIVFVTHRDALGFWFAYCISHKKSWAVLIYAVCQQNLSFLYFKMQGLLIKHLTNSSRETLKFIAHCLWGGSEREGLPAASSWICPFGSFSLALVRFTCSPVGPFTLYTLSRPAPHNIQRWKMSNCAILPSRYTWFPIFIVSLKYKFHFIFGDVHGDFLLWKYVFCPHQFCKINIKVAHICFPFF